MLTINLCYDTPDLTSAEERGLAVRVAKALEEKREKEEVVRRVNTRAQAKKDRNEKEETERQLTEEKPKPRIHEEVDLSQMS